MAVIAMVVLVVIAPLRRTDRPRAQTRSRERLAALEAAKEAKYREIRDAELDLRTGKLTEPDFRTIDRSLRREAIEILRTIDELKEEEAGSG